MFFVVFAIELGKYITSCNYSEFELSDFEHKGNNERCNSRNKA